MISNKKFFLLFGLFIGLFTWHSCSRTTPANSQKVYNLNIAGEKSNKIKCKSNLEKTKEKYLHSIKEWNNLIKNDKKLSFIELKIDDFGSQKERVTKKSIDYPNTIKIIEIRNSIDDSKIVKISKNIIKSEQELTVLFIHGLGGKEGDYFSIIRKLAKENFKGRVNLITGKRFDSCFKTINQQANEVKKKLEEYLSKYSKQSKHKLMIVGHSQGGIITLSLLNKLIKKPNLEIAGLILIGTPLGGIDATKKFMDEQRKTYPNIIGMIEKSIFGCTLEKNPLGVVQTINKNLIKIIRRANIIIKENAIPTKVLIGIKPSGIEYPNTLFCFIKRLYRLINHKILNVNAIKTDFSFSKIWYTIKESIIGIPKMKSIFSAEKLAGDKESDFLLSKCTQTWCHKTYRNKYVKNIILNGVVHNWKISLLVSNSISSRVAAELESKRTIKIIKKMINNIFNGIYQNI